MDITKETSLCGNLSEKEQFDLLEEVILQYEGNEKNLIQILHMAQAIFGYLPGNVQEYIAHKTGIPYSKVSGVVTFYSFFSSKPKGEYVISICLGTACYVRGGKKILEKLKELLNIDVGETTPDLKFTLQVMRCIGACSLAPAISINGKVYKQVNPNKISQILNEYR